MSNTSSDNLCGDVQQLILGYTDSTATEALRGQFNRTTLFHNVCNLYKLNAERAAQHILVNELEAALK